MYCRNKQYNTWFMSTDVLSWFYCWFSLACVVFYWNMVFGTICYHLIIKSNLSINLNNLLVRLCYLLISFNSCCLSRSTTVLLLNEGYCVIAGEKIASLSLLEKQVHSHTGRNLQHHHHHPHISYLFLFCSC